MRNLIFLGAIALQLNAIGQAGCQPTASMIYGGDTASYGFNDSISYYEIIAIPATWHEAAACAKSRGGKLAEVKGQTDETLLGNIAFFAVFSGNLRLQSSPVPGAGGAYYLWLGANDFAQEGVWRWDGDGDSLGTVFWRGEGLGGSGNGRLDSSYFFQNWGGKSQGFVQEPDNKNGTQDALAMKFESGSSDTLVGFSEWADLTHTNKLPFMVEYKFHISALGDAELPLSSLEIYPNPANNYLKIEIDQAIWKYAAIYNAAGQLLKELVLEQSCNEINLSPFENGLYFIQVFDEDRMRVLRRSFVKK